MRKIIGLAVVATIASSSYASDVKTNVYGYIEGYVEQVEETPQRSGGTSTAEGDVSKKLTPINLTHPM